MLDKKNISKIFTISAALLLLVLSKPAQADNWKGWGNHDRDDSRHNRNSYRRDRDNDSQHRQHSYGRAVISLPHGSIKIVIGGGRYYYCDGLFYRHNTRDYVVVPAPVGAVVYNVPVGYHQVISNGVTYLTYDGVYYRRTLRGYEVVQPPATVVVASAASSYQDSITVNIPHATGRFVAVTLQRSGNGFIGPQGEYYPEFPRVEQLQVMYGN